MPAPFDTTIKLTSSRRLITGGFFFGLANRPKLWMVRRFPARNAEVIAMTPDLENLFSGIFENAEAMAADSPSDRSFDLPPVDETIANVTGDLETITVTSDGYHLRAHGGAPLRRE